MELISLALQCQGGMSGITWPDGRGLLDQPVKMIRAFNLIYGIESSFKPKKNGAP